MPAQVGVRLAARFGLTLDEAAAGGSLHEPPPDFDRRSRTWPRTSADAETLLVSP